MAADRPPRPEPITIIEIDLALNEIWFNVYQREFVWLLTSLGASSARPTTGCNLFLRIDTANVLQREANVTYQNSCWGIMNEGVHDVLNQAAYCISFAHCGLSDKVQSISAFLLCLQIFCRNKHHIRMLLFH